MKKRTLILLAILIFILPLSACGINMVKNSTNTDKLNSSTEIFKKNQKEWQESINDLPIIKASNPIDDQNFIAKSLSQFQNDNKLAIKGTIVNLQKMDSPNNYALTKATVHVDQVIKGNKGLQGKNLIVVLNGGITTTNSWYANKNQTREADHEILVQYRKLPLPKIGSSIITGLKSVHDFQPSKYSEALKQSHFDFRNYYLASMPEYNFWTKESKNRQFQLNNPQAFKKLEKNFVLKQDLKKLTETLNQKYNK